MPEQIRFIHRTNDDRSFDTICLTCFATVTTERLEAELFQWEQVHVCNSAVLFTRSSFAWKN
jgi:hypothetical protein